MSKRFYRSRKERMISGVCGGIAEYFNLDPSLVRIIWILFSLPGAGVLAYIVAVLIIPEKPIDFGHCPKCGEETDTSELYCKHCGHQLQPTRVLEDER